MRYRRRVAALVSGLATTGTLLGAGLAGCGGDSNQASTGASPGASVGRQAFTAYLSCLKDHGVTITLPSRRAGRNGARPSLRPSARPSGPRPSGGFPTGFPGRGGFPDGGFLGGDQPPAGVTQKTWQAAQSACAAVRPSFGVGGRGPGGSAFAAYANCLKDHGVTASTGPERFDTADPEVAAAMAACAPLRPSGEPRPTSS